MSPTVQLALAVLLGLGGWQVFKRLKFPLPAILGPMTAVAIAGSLGLIQTTFPPSIKLWLQITVGVFAGYRVDRQALSNMRTMLGPISLAAAWLTAAALLIGFLLSATTGIDFTTGLLGASPGGLAEMSALAVSLGADVAIVASLQVFRLVATYLLIPSFARRLSPALSSVARPSAVLPLPLLQPAGFPRPIEPSPLIPAAYSAGAAETAVLPNCGRATPAARRPAATGFPLSLAVLTGWSAWPSERWERTACSPCVCRAPR